MRSAFFQDSLEMVEAKSGSELGKHFPNHGSPSDRFVGTPLHPIARKAGQ